jgi:prepilin-type processing-associated H-X9-DG protein
MCLVVLFLPGVRRHAHAGSPKRVHAEAANRSRCQNNLKQIGVALHNYHDTNQSFPPGYLATVPYVDGANDTTPGWGWGAFLLPYLEQNTVSNTIHFDRPIQDSFNASAIQVVMPVYGCPSDLLPNGAFPVPDGFESTVALAAPCSYAACVGGDESDTTGPDGSGVFYRNSRTRIADITDGTSTTLLIGERAWANANGIWAGAIPGGVTLRGQFNPCPGTGAGWYPAATLVLAHSHLNNTTTDSDGGLDDFSSRHLGGSHFAFADGSVHFIRSVVSDPPGGGYSLDSQIFQALGTRATGEVIPEDWFN